LHFALGELFGQYGKIKKIELYMEKGILETENFKGEALVVYHKTKKTGSHDKGDPVYEACTDMDGRFRILGHRNWRVRCEAAKFEKEGYDVKDRAKLFPCVELTNLWEYNPALPMSWFMQMQEEIRKHAETNITSPFVKVEPSEGSAMIWCKGAQDAMKFASLMQKSYFMGRKIVASLCRKPKPAVEHMPKLPVGELTLRLPAAGSADAEAKASVEQAPPEPAAEATVATAAAPPAFLLREGCKAVLRGLVAKPENNGKRAEIERFLPEVNKYQVRLEDGRVVRLKPENLEAIAEIAPGSNAAMEVEADSDAEKAEEEASSAALATLEAAQAMAEGKVRHGPEPVSDPNVDGFTATVCVDPSLLKKKESEEEAPKRRESSRSRERRQQDRIAAVQARLAADKGPRPSWCVPAPGEAGAKATATGGATGAGGSIRKEPEESREELMKMPVSKLKEMLKEFGKGARGCIEKRDFVDRLKPAPKA